MTVLVVTGTDTGVGKTITTAAVAAVLRAAGGSVAAYKPVQSGLSATEPADSDVIGRLAAIVTAEGIRLARPMAPLAAAARENAALPTLDGHVARVHALLVDHDDVLVEGSGGLLVQLDEARHTLADLTARLQDAAVIVVCRSGLGTLNHTALTVEALTRRGLTVRGLVIGSWPQYPDDIDLDNREQLSRSGVPLLGAVPAGASELAPDIFRSAAAQWLPGLR